MEGAGRENVPRPMAGMSRGTWDVDVEGVGIEMEMGNEEGYGDGGAGGRDILEEVQVWREGREGKESGVGSLAW